MVFDWLSDGDDTENREAAEQQKFWIGKWQRINDAIICENENPYTYSIIEKREEWYGLEIHKSDMNGLVLLIDRKIPNGKKMLVRESEREIGSAAFEEYTKLKEKNKNR